MFVHMCVMEGIDLSTTQTENSDGSDEAKTGDSFGNGSDDGMEVSESQDRSDDEQCTMFNGKPYKDLELDDLSNVVFKSVEEEEMFYIHYSVAKGFSIRKYKLAWNSENSNYHKRNGLCKERDVKGRLANMFWRDGQSYMDYCSYGDVLIFDSTYKTNMYEKPLVVFVGTNNHRGTVIFGSALLVDETEETYNWVLTAFLASMKQKKLVSVINDSDEAMRKALGNVMPEARHCYVHGMLGKM
ncbi:hypothetical protein ACLB2K_014377 [Fragaria x ananassa]